MRKIRISTDEFMDLDSDICVSLGKSDQEYINLMKEISALLSSNFALNRLLDQDEPVSLTQEDATAFQAYRKLQRRAEAIERFAIYCKGFEDCSRQEIP